MKDEMMAYTLPETAKMLRISVRKVYDEIGKKRLLSFKIGDRRLVSREAIVGYINARQDEER